MKKFGTRAVKKTTRLGMKFLRVGSRVPGQIVRDSRLLGKKIRRKIRRVTKRRGKKSRKSHRKRR